MSGKYDWNGKSLTSLGICWLDEDTFLGKLAMLGQLTLTGKPNITLQFVDLTSVLFKVKLQVAPANLSK